VVLSTNVAESSLTVDNVRCVIDCGYERNPRYNGASGLTFLETELVSRASAAQRTGRAGRTAPGKALRLWDMNSHGGRKAFKTPEICEGDLTALALEIALWGARKEELEWLDMPPEGPYAESVKLLQLLGALDQEGHPTPFGRNISRFPVHPRIGAIIAEGIRRQETYLALEIAALLENPSDSSFPSEADLLHHIDYLRNNLKKHRRHQQLLEQLAKAAGAEKKFHSIHSCGELLLAGFPDRLGRMRRSGKNGFTLRNGRGGKLPEGEVLPQSEFLVAAEIGGKSSGDGTIFKYATLSREYVLEKYASSITSNRSCFFDSDSGRILCRKETLLGGMILSSTPVPPEPGEVAQGVFDAALKRGIPLVSESDKGGFALRERILFAHRNDPEEFPLLDDLQLAKKSWGYFPELKSLNQLDKLSWTPVLRSLLGEDRWEKLNRLYPEKFRTPAGAEHRIDYSRPVPFLSVKLQEMLGVKTHPVLGLKKLPLCIELLSPALRPIQTTSDLPGFWQGSYALVRKEMKSRYPKHEWPENPADAPPMLRSIKR
jgi:ATP-dependent helicase HrpB